MTYAVVLKYERRIGGLYNEEFEIPVISGYVEANNLTDAAFAAKIQTNGGYYELCPVVEPATLAASSN